MTLTNREIADIFDTVADMLEIKGEIIHRILSYRRGAETIRDLPRDLNAIVDSGEDLTKLPGIGKTLAEKINEMLETGELTFYNRLKDEVPTGVVDMMRINGVGPKKAKRFWEELDLTSIEQLEAAAKEGKLRELSGMGAKSEQKILDGIDSLARQQTDRVRLGDAEPAARKILNRLMQLDEALRGEIAGSIRRARPTIGDVDILIAVENEDDATPIMQAFVDMDEVARVLGQGPTKSSVELLNGLQVDVRVLPQERWGTGLSYFTGSQQHNIRMRELALKQNLSLNEHAFTRTDAPDSDKILCSTEEDVYTTVGLSWIPPELREDRGEIEAAQRGELPGLISLNDVQADLHMHTTWSDGKLTVREMAEAAKARGRKFIVITDHSRSLGIANGLSVDRLLRQQDEVQQVNEQMGDDIRVFHGTEMDILADGSMDYPDEILERLDFVIASLHVSLTQPREQVTARVLNAIHNPHVDLIGHPRGQYILRREPADLDMDTVFTAAKEYNTALEINANPHRLDLEAQYARRAVEMGITLSINTDAHAEDQMDLMHYGVRTARRGWVEAPNVINTWSVEHFVEWVEGRG